MQYCVLGIGYLQSEYAEEARTWAGFAIGVDFADNVEQAVQKLSCMDYICVVVRSENITADELCALYQTAPIPILVLPPSYNAAQRRICVQLNVMQHLHAVKLHLNIPPHTTLQGYLNIPTSQLHGLTVISVKDMSLCLEYRSVEVRGQRIELTAKEFDILALLIMNQKRVFTYEMLLEIIWHEDIDYFSRKAIHNHVSRLNKKLKVAPDVPDYIKSIRGVGYKFEI